jgi:hypothetical protein
MMLASRPVEKQWHPVAQDQDARRSQGINQPKSSYLHRIDGYI